MMIGLPKRLLRIPSRSILSGALLLLFTLPLMLGACQSQNVKVQTIGEGVINLNHETGYFKLQDYESDRVKAISTGIADSRFLACAQTGDGTLVLYRAGEEGAETVSLPTVRKYDSQGNMSWEKDFDIPEMDGGSGKLIPMDDGFLLTLSRWPYTQQSEMVYPKHHLIRCDGEGSILWHEALDSYSGEFIQQVFVTDSDEIVTVGCWNYANGEQTADAPSDLVLMRFNENGKMLQQKSIGGNDFERLICASYSEEFGLVLGCHSQSQPVQGYYLACFDLDFNQVWQYEPFEADYVGDFSLAMGDECLYLMGNVFREQGNQGLLIKLDRSGNEIWRENSPVGYHSMAVLDNGNVVLSGSEGDKDFLIVKSPDNEVLYEMKSRADLSQMQIFPVDGGFVTTSRRMIKTVPQPAYISSIWYDTEVTATRYDNRLDMVWRKTFDRYKNTRETDLVYPLKDGRLLVE